MKKRACLILLSFVLSAYTVSAANILQGITITPEENPSTYDRALYTHWTDADDDNEDTRQEVLIEESLDDVDMQTDGNRRFVVSGFWVGPYTGRYFTNPSEVDVDHMVPLGEAHRSEAYAWDQAKREAYANDVSNPQHLIAVEDGANQSKGDRDPANWMPPNRTYWCQYLTDWVEVKRQWELSVDQAEADAIQKGWSVCKKYKVGDHLDGRHQ